MPASASRPSALLDRCSALLSAAGVPHQRIDGEVPLLELEWRGRAGTHGALIEAWDEARRLKVYAYLPLVVPEAARARACELLMRANGTLAFGSFDLDLDGGGVRFRAGTVADAATLDGATLELLVEGSLQIADAWVEGLAAVIAGTCTPAVACAEVTARLSR